MKTTSDKVKQEIHIDEYNLQNEWLRQSNLVIKYAGLAAKTRKKRDLMDRKIAVRRSQVNILARENPADFFPKPPDRITESLIEHTGDPTGELWKSKENNEELFVQRMSDALVMSKYNMKTIPDTVKVKGLERRRVKKH